MAPRGKFNAENEAAGAEYKSAIQVEDRTTLHRTPAGQEIPTGFIPERRFNPNAPSAPGRAVDVGFNNLLASVHARHDATGIQPCTILNFLPIPLVVNSPMASLKVRIPPAPDVTEGSDLFSFHTWHDAAIEVAYRGEKINQPVDYLPVQIAKAFIDEYADYGGVVLLRGLPNAETLSKPQVVQDIQVGRDKMIVWMRMRVDKANGQWNTVNKSGARNITEVDRACAKRLKDLGIIDFLPEWMTETRTLNEVQKKCPLCATQPALGAVECVNCHYVLDPAAAYVAGAIDVDHSALERLTRKEVEDLGISLYVAETSDEKPNRIKLGMMKPLSVVAAREAGLAEQPKTIPAL